MIYLILALITGILVKLTDVIIDDKRAFLFRNSEILFGAMYGVLIGVMIALYPIIAPLWVGVVLGVLVTKKIDHIGHIVALPMIALAVYLFGFQKFSLVLSLVFFVVCVVEELVNNYIDRLKDSIFVKFMKLRPIVEIAALVVSVFFGFEIFFAILGFDIGYIFVSKVFKQLPL